MKIGVPKEIKNHEYRVGLTPASVRELTSRGHEVLVQTGAGAAIGLTDEEYVAAGAKIAALGLRIRRGCSYHGLSLNVAMELAPFSAINPCGYAGMPVTQLRDLGVDLAPAQAGARLVERLRRQLQLPTEHS